MSLDAEAGRILARTRQGRALAVAFCVVILVWVVCVLYEMSARPEWYAISMVFVALLGGISIGRLEIVAQKARLALVSPEGLADFMLRYRMARRRMLRRTRVAAPGMAVVLGVLLAVVRPSGGAGYWIGAAVLVVGLLAGATHAHLNLRKLGG
jgi:hypothetical protein